MGETRFAALSVAVAPLASSANRRKLVGFGVNRSGGVSLAGSIRAPFGPTWTWGCMTLVGQLDFPHPVPMEMWLRLAPSASRNPGFNR